MSETISPTAAITGYLRSKGLQPTSENVRRTLEANAANPGMIPGLTNQAPPSAEEAPPQAPRRSAPSVAPPSPVSGGEAMGPEMPMPTPPMSPTSPGSPVPTADVQASTSTDGSGGGLNINLGEAILGALGAAGGGMGSAYLFNLLRGRTAAPQAAPFPNIGMPDNSAMVDPNAPRIGQAPPQISNQAMPDDGIQRALSAVDTPTQIQQAPQPAQIGGPQAQKQVTGSPAPKQITDQSVISLPDGNSKSGAYDNHEGVDPYQKMPQTSGNAAYDEEHAKAMKEVEGSKPSRTDPNTAKAVKKGMTDKPATDIMAEFKKFIKGAARR